MKTRYVFGLLLETTSSWYVTGSRPYYRFFSGHHAGPWCPTRREAAWEWLKGWL